MTDIPLTANGEEIIRSKSAEIVGPGSTFPLPFPSLPFHSHRSTTTKHLPLTSYFSLDQPPVPIELVDPADLCHVYISPRQRAQKTYELLFKDLPETEKPIHTTTAAVREWDYGEYEGLLPREIKAKNPGWSIWSDG